MKKVLSYFALVFSLLFFVSCTNSSVSVEITAKDNIEIANGDSEFFSRTENLEIFIVKVDEKLTDVLDVSISVDYSSVNFDVAGYYSITVSVIVKSKEYKEVFVVCVLAKEKTDAELVAEAKSALVIPTTATDNFTLPVSVSGNITITWSSNNAAITISAGNATVVRPASNQNDVTVTLTATITKGTVSDTKVFSVIVAKSVQTDEEAVNAVKSTLILPSGVNASAVESNFILPTAGLNGVNIEWSSNDASISISGANATVVRPAYESGNATVTLTATITKGSVSTTKEFTLVVTRLDQTDDELVLEVKNSLTLPSSVNPNSVTENFVLPTSDKTASISWSSNNEAITISGGNATVVRPVYGSGNATVTLTATITKGTASDTKTFNIVVLELSGTTDGFRYLSTEEKALFTAAMGKDYSNMTIYDGLYWAEYYYVNNYVYVVDAESGELAYYGYIEDGKYYMYDEDGLQEIELDDYEYWFLFFDFSIIDVEKLVTDEEYIYLYADDVDIDYFAYYYSDLDINYFTFEISSDGYFEYIGICDNYEGAEDFNFLEIYGIGTTVAPDEEGPVSGDFRELTTEEKALFTAAMGKDYSNMTIYDGLYWAEYYYVNNYVYVVDAESGELAYYGYIEDGKYYMYDEDGLQEIELDDYEYWFLFFDFSIIDVDKLVTDEEYIYLYADDVDIDYFAYYYSDLDINYFTFEISADGYFEYIGICDNYEGAEDFNFLEIYGIGTTVAPDDELPEPGEYDSVADVLNGTIGTKYTVKAIVVEFIYSAGSPIGRVGFYISDDTGIIYVYGNSKIHDIEIGDLIVITANRVVYNGFVQLSSYTIDEIVAYNQTPNYDNHVVKTTMDDLFDSNLTVNNANIVYELEVIVNFTDGGNYSSFKIVSPTDSSNVFNIYVSGTILAENLKALYPELAENIDKQITVLFVINGVNSSSTFRGIILGIVD